jgi:hypothetical protein
MEDRVLGDLRLAREGTVVLGIRRADGRTPARPLA